VPYNEFFLSFISICPNEYFFPLFIREKNKTTMQPGGQSLVDRFLAAKNTIAGQALAKVVCKATTEEIIGPKRKHLDCELKI
jgi:hypothetical protein